MKKQALISVSDKTGVVDFARELVALGYHILSTGGTAKLLTKEGVPCQEVADYTGFPEMLDGRVKTLNPKIHAGILARRPVAEHMAALEAHGIDPIDIICVNLYPFEQTIAKPDCTFEDAIENIDIGGPTMIRAAAKNHESVAVIVDPTDYASVVAEIKAEGGVTAATRLALAKKVFAHTARYDGMITNYLTSLDENNQRTRFPQVLTRQWEKVQDMRYGENPHQAAAFYRESSVAPGLLAGYEQLQGKELSYNNIADSDAAWECVRSFEAPACVIIKHANPCGVAVGISSAEAYSKAFQTDSKSAFGGIIAFNREVTGECAELVSRQFAEVHHRPELLQGSGRDLRRQEESPSSDGRSRQGPQRLRLQARRRRPARSDARQPDLRRRRPALRDEAPANVVPDRRPDVRLERRPLREVQHDRLCPRRHDARRRCRPDEPRRFRPHRHAQG